VRVLVVGLNHRTAPVKAREQLAFSREGVSTALMLFKSQFPDCEAAILSTCNRVEIIASGDPSKISLKQLLAFLSQARRVAVESFEPYLYQYQGRAALRHVFRVIGGLDSMVLGEYQIVNQLKQAYQLAHERNTAGPILHRLFHHAFGVSKRMRTETGIADGKLSVPSVAVDIIRKHLPDYRSKRILIVGAGEMAQLAVQYLTKAEATNFAIVTRTHANGQALADVCKGEAHPFTALDEQLARADVVITATACPIPFLNTPRIQAAQIARGAKPLLLIDLAVPRNIDPAAANIPGVSLSDVDALGFISQTNHADREAQVELCDQIVDEEVKAFQKWVAESRVGPLIERMYRDVREVADIEVRAFLRQCRDLKPEQQQQVNALVDRLVNKLMHPCVTTVRQQSASGFDSEVFDADPGACTGACTAPAKNSSIPADDVSADAALV
jgi:glutamyl-tRNA reductase